MEKQSYSRRSAWIHWVSALLIFALLYTGISMEHGAHNPEKFSTYQLHFALGFAVFILSIWRIAALLKDGKPAPLYPQKSIRQRFINFVHYGFYVVLLWMCISGIWSLSLEGILPALLSNNFADLPEINSDGFHPIMLSHHIMAKIVMLLLLFHVSGFFIHLLQKGDNTIRRIWVK